MKWQTPDGLAQLCQPHARRLHKPAPQRLRSVTTAFVDEDELLQEIVFHALVRVEAIEKARETRAELRRIRGSRELDEASQSLAHLNVFGAERSHPS